MNHGFRKKNGRRGIVCGVTFVGLIAQFATADDAARLMRFHQAIVNPQKVISEDRGDKTRDFLDGADLQKDNLDSNAKVAAQQLDVFAELARGNAAGALQSFEKLAAERPDDLLTHQAGYLVGAAAGNAELADRSLTALATMEPGKRDEYRERSTRLDFVGRKFAEIPGLNDGDNKKVLVLDIWSTQDKRDSRREAALARAFADYGKQDQVQFVGFCADDQPTAEPVVKSSRRTWPQHYVDSTPFATAKSALRFEETPLVLVVDAAGFVRASAAADDPAFHYALRAAAHEAANEFVVVPPRDRAGVGAYADPSKSEVIKPAKPAAQADATPTRVNSPEAEKLLERARLFTRTGRKNDARKLLQQILDEYPNSMQAEEAESRLRAL